MSLWRNAPSAKAHSLDSCVIKEEVGHRSQLCCRGCGILFLFVLLTFIDKIVAELQSRTPFPPPNSSPGHEEAFQNLKLVTPNQPIFVVSLVL